MAKMPVQANRTEGGTAVFDAGKSAGTAHDAFLSEVVVGEHIGVSRRDRKDSKPGRPIPFGEPDPDRFVKSDALRATFAAKGDFRARNADTHKTRSYSAPREPDPKYLCDPGEAQVKAAAEGRSVYFRTEADAFVAMTGRDPPELGDAIYRATHTGMRRYGWFWSREAKKNSRRA